MSKKIAILALFFISISLSLVIITMRYKAARTVAQREAAIEPAFTVEFSPVAGAESALETKLTKEEYAGQMSDAFYCRNISQHYFSGEVNVKIIDSGIGKDLITETIKLDRLPPGAFCTTFYAFREVKGPLKLESEVKGGQLYRAQITRNPNIDAPEMAPLPMHNSRLVFAVLTSKKDLNTIKSVGRAYSEMFPNAQSLGVLFFTDPVPVPNRSAGTKGFSDFMGKAWASYNHSPKSGKPPTIQSQ